MDIAKCKLTLVGLIISRIFRSFSGFFGEVKPPPATLSMVAGGGGLVSDVYMLSMPLVHRFRSLKNHKYKFKSECH